MYAWGLLSNHYLCYGSLHISLVTKVVNHAIFGDCVLSGLVSVKGQI
jgi:hypothetical protein